MSELLQAIRGMSDVLPKDSYLWRFLERVFGETLSDYGYKEVRTPLLEQTALFKRSIGEITDIVEKEMYTFTDRNGDSLSLRPEGTASCVRACLEHGLLHNQQQKLWYIGPMFRHEKPQKGRYRQFHQFGAEVFGIDGIGIELELIALCQRLWTRLGINDVVHLEINTLGTIEERQNYRNDLIHYFKQHESILDEDSKRRLEKNPMRILDSKNEALKSLIQNAPKLMDFLSDESRTYFESLCEGLRTLGIAFTINTCLVRGLDYYEHTVFEWTTTRLGSQATVCAGGRFNKLVEHLGGKSTSAVGFALGQERLLLLCQEVAADLPSEILPDLIVLPGTSEAMIQALKIAENLRDKAPQWLVQVNTAAGSFKSQFKKADKSGARLALIIGEEEAQNKTVGIKDLRGTTPQQLVSQSELLNAILAYMGE